MNTSDFKDRVLAAVPIDSYVGRHVSLKRYGKTFKGLCPFHTEKTPSFTVNPERGLFHCFGCSRGGDVITFVMEQEHIPFREALAILARFAGIEEPKGKWGPADPKKKALAAVNDRVVELYRKCLEQSEGQDVLEYYKKRGLQENSIREFELGAAPESWRFLDQALPGHQKEMIELGLLKRPEKGGDPYDFFRARAIFPIRELSGTVAGFGGRILPGSENPAKYLNSPDSLLFKKGALLYGLYQGLGSVRQSGYCIITEGYLDVIGMSQAGIANTVAPLGTAFGESHLRILRRYTDTILLMLDGDEAGRRAALRAARTVAEDEKMKASVLLLPEGKDPFDLSLALGETQLRELLEQAIPAERFLITESLFSGMLETSPGEYSKDDPIDYTRACFKFYMSDEVGANLPIEKKREAIRRLHDLCLSIKKPSIKDLFRQEGARLLKLSASDLKIEEGREHSPYGESRERENHNQESFHRHDSHAVAVVKIDDPRSQRLRRIEHEMIAELLYNPTLTGTYLEDLARLEFVDPAAEVIWRNMESRYLSGDVWTADTYRQTPLPGDALALTAALLVRDAERLAAGTAVSDASSEQSDHQALGELILAHRLSRIGFAMDDLHGALAAASPLEKDELIKKYASLALEKRGLENDRRGSLEKSTPGGVE